MCDLIVSNAQILDQASSRAIWQIVWQELGDAPASEKGSGLDIDLDYCRDHNPQIIRIIYNKIQGRKAALSRPFVSRQSSLGAK